jgi:hypothetical protein
MGYITAGRKMLSLTGSEDDVPAVENDKGSAHPQDSSLMNRMIAAEKMTNDINKLAACSII